MKLLIIGAGGISSFLVEELASCIDQGQLNNLDSCSVADDDIVELNQLKYQNFTKEEIGMNKSRALCKRVKVTGMNFFTPIHNRILREKQLDGYDVYVLCADNDKVRKLVTGYCHKTSKEFLDLRATGRKVFCAPKLRTLAENMKYIDENDNNTYSCQDKKDLEQGLIQKGNIISAMIGIQMLLNLSRNHDNHLINLVI